MIHRTGFVAVVVFGLWVIVIAFPPGPKLVCHRQIEGAFDQWAIETSNGLWYPNINGRSSESLAVLHEKYFRDVSSMRDYRYVPGLKKGDPGDLILMYTVEPTRRRRHGDHEWYRHPKKWVVLNVNFDDGKRAEWEMNESSEALPTEEFTNRLQKTLIFLQQQKRPYWTNIVGEPSQFLSRTDRVVVRGR